MKQFVQSLEDGMDVVMWQLNKSEDKDAPAEFPMKASHVTVKLQKKGDLFVQSVIQFILRGGYLSKAIGRNRGGKCSFFLFCLFFRVTMYGISTLRIVSHLVGRYS